MYKLGNKSMSKLLGVNPILAFAVMEAIKITKQDFSVFEGLRTISKQKQNVKRGVSWTMNSKHLTGNAVDLVVFKDGKPQWDNVRHEYEQIAKAMRMVIKNHNLPIDYGFDLWGKDLPHWQVRKPYSDLYNARNFKFSKIVKLKL